MRDTGQAVADALFDRADWEPVYYLNRHPDSTLPCVAQRGIIRFGGMEIECVRLKDGRRLFTGKEVKVKGWKCTRPSGGRND